jgi:hypothetical protein
MNKSDAKVKQRNVGRDGGLPEQETEWQSPRLIVWEVVENTAQPPAKTASGADSQGMRDVFD